MIHNRQKRVIVKLRPLRDFEERLVRHLRMAPRRFDVTLVDDVEIRKLNRRFRGKDAPTDVLSFTCQNQGGCARPWRRPAFLGDIVISTWAARRNAKAEGHSIETELFQLILHGVLHLQGYDHAADAGEMDALELRLRARLGIEG